MEMNTDELDTHALLSNNYPQSDQGDFHLSGFVIASLQSGDSKDSPYKVRAILDSGAGTNFISESILPHIKYEHLATKNLNVAGINSSENKIFKLVEVFVDSEYAQNLSFKCYTIPTLINFNVNEQDLSMFYKQFIKDCAPKGTSVPQVSADHGKGIGLVLGPGTIRDISVGNPKYINSYLVDFTIFGPAVSGRLPVNNQSNTSLNAVLQEITSSSQSVDHITLPISNSVNHISNEVNEIQFSSESDIDNKIELFEDLKSKSEAWFKFGSGQNLWGIRARF